MPIYETQELEAKAIEAIEKNFLTFFDDLCIFLSCSRSTLYNHGLDKMDTIKEALEKNRLMIKREMRQRWQKHDSPVLQVAAYKLIGSDEELQKLTMNKFEHTGDKGGPIQTESKHIVEIHDFSDGNTSDVQ